MSDIVVLFIDDFDENIKSFNAIKVDDFPQDAVGEFNLILEARQATDYDAAIRIINDVQPNIILLDCRLKENTDDEMAKSVLHVLQNASLGKTRICLLATSFSTGRIAKELEKKDHDLKKYLISENTHSLGSKKDGEDLICLALNHWRGFQGDSLADLYEKCWQDREILNSSKDKPFHHDSFTEESKICTEIVTWLGGDLPFDSESIKGLFMVGHELGQIKRLHQTRSVKREYLERALGALKIKADLAAEVREWQLPFAPGIAFLFAVKNLQVAFTCDASSKKVRPEPKFELLQYSSKSRRGDTIGRLRITLRAKEIHRTGALRLMRKFYADAPANMSGARLALMHLLYAHSDNIPGEIKTPWPKVFKLDNIGNAEPVAGVHFEERCINIFWKVR